MAEHKKKRGRGKKTFFFILITRGKWYLIFGIIFLLIGYQIYFGGWHDSMENYLTVNDGWHISIDMVSEWMLLLGISFIFIAYLRARVLYRQFRFTVDEYAFTLLRGLYFTHETTIPYKQITNVHVYRPYHYKMFGVSKLDIVTAADRSIENSDNKSKKFLIPIIDTSEARKLSKYLLRKAAESRDEDFEDSDENGNEDGESESRAETEDNT